MKLKKLFNDKSNHKIYYWIDKFLDRVRDRNSYRD